MRRLMFTFSTTPSFIRTRTSKGIWRRIIDEMNVIKIDWVFEEEFGQFYAAA